MPIAALNGGLPIILEEKQIIEYKIYLYTLYHLENICTYTQ